MKKSAILFLILAGVSLPYSSHALTPADIQAQIQALMQQIQYLQQQIGQLNYGGGGYYGGNYNSCTTFSVNLGIGSMGGDVSALQSILQNEGFTISYNETGSSYYGQSTAAAVSAFQLKYYSDILAPYGLFTGTGRVGPSTRAKLNQLSQTNCGQNYYNPNNQYPYNNCSQTYPYNCGNCVYPYTNCNQNPSYGTINVTSPSSGQTYQSGSSVYVAWNSSNYYSYSNTNQNFTVELWQNGNFITRMSAGATNSMNFTLPNYLNYGSNYFFKVYDQSNQSVSGNSQMFTVGFGTSGAGVTILGPNGGEQVRINTTYPIQFTVSTNQSAFRVRIELWQNGYFLGVITDGLPVFQNQTQTHYWNAGNYSDSSSGASRTASAGYGYKVRVLVYDSSGQLITSDDSNSPFNLTF